MSSHQYRDSHVKKIRRSHDRLIFNMGIPIPGENGLYIETGPGPWSRRFERFSQDIFSERHNETEMSSFWRNFRDCPGNGHSSVDAPEAAVLRPYGADKDGYFLFGAKYRDSITSSLSVLKSIKCKIWKINFYFSSKTIQHVNRCFKKPPCYFVTKYSAAPHEINHLHINAAVTLFHSNPKHK